MGQSCCRTGGLSVRAGGVKAQLGRKARTDAPTGIMLSLPNILTLSRILAVPILLFLVWPGVAEGSLQPKPID